MGRQGRGTLDATMLFSPVAKDQEQLRQQIEAFQAGSAALQTGPTRPEVRQLAWTERPETRQAGRQAGRQPGRQAGRQAARQPGRQCAVWPVSNPAKTSSEPSRTHGWPASRELRPFSYLGFRKFQPTVRARTDLESVCGP